LQSASAFHWVIYIKNVLSAMALTHTLLWELMTLPELLSQILRAILWQRKKTGKGNEELKGRERRIARNKYFCLRPCLVGSRMPHIGTQLISLSPFPKFWIGPYKCKHY